MATSENSSSSSNDEYWSERQQEFDEWSSQFEVEDKLLEEMLRSAQQIPKNRQITQRRYLEREREQGHARLYNDYFANDPVYPPEKFRLRFRMRRGVFLRIMESLMATDVFFQQRVNATGRVGLSTHQKCTAAIRVLAYGTSYDAVDEYLRVSETSARQSVIHFVDGIISNFGNEYLRKPNEADLTKLLHVGASRGFPGMLGSIDCMHWKWKNCPTGWAGQYSGRSGIPTIILEAVASYDLWIWHAFFGTPGSNNDINVLQRSPVFDDIFNGRAPPVTFEVNGHQYDMGYYLTDGIYPPWATFVKSVPSPQIAKLKLFAKYQEGYRKDVERAFGVLQARWAIIRRPALCWDKRLMAKVMIACIIMHNMIVEDERDIIPNYWDPREFIEDRPTPRTNRPSGGDEDQNLQYSTARIANMESHFVENMSRVRDPLIHNALKEDLIEHIWQMFRPINNNNN